MSQKEGENRPEGVINLIKKIGVSHELRELGTGETLKGLLGTIEPSESESSLKISETINKLVEFLTKTGREKIYYGCRLGRWNEEVILRILNEQGAALEFIVNTKSKALIKCSEGDLQKQVDLLDFAERLMVIGRFVSFVS